MKGQGDVTVTARRAVHGMVLAHSAEDGLAWARARAWEGQELASLMAWTLLPTDKSLDAAHRRIGKLATNINMYTMDAAGNLGYVHAGRYPDRAPGHARSSLEGLARGEAAPHPSTATGGRLPGGAHGPRVLRSAELPPSPLRSCG